MSGEFGAAGFKKPSIIDDMAASSSSRKSYDAPRQAEDDFNSTEVRFKEETLPETLDKMQSYISKAALNDTVEDPNA